MNDIEQNRRQYIEDLRTNPHNLKQLFTGDLVDGEDCACALGLGCYTFGIDPHELYHVDEVTGQRQSPYFRLSRLLGLRTTDEKLAEEQLGPDGYPPEDDIDRIWHWNDRGRLTYAEIADKCQEWWFPGDSVTLNSADITEDK